MVCDAEDMPSEHGEVTIASRIVAGTLLVGRPVNLDDESDLRRREVEDEARDDELSAEGESCLGAGEASPEPVLGAGWSAAHGASPLVEELGVAR